MYYLHSRGVTIAYIINVNDFTTSNFYYEVTDMLHVFQTGIFEKCFCKYSLHPQEPGGLDWAGGVQSSPSLFLSSFSSVKLWHANLWQKRRQAWLKLTSSMLFGNYGTIWVRKECLSRGIKILVNHLFLGYSSYRYFFTKKSVEGNWRVLLFFSPILGSFSDWERWSYPHT